MHFLVCGFWGGYTNFDEISQLIEPEPRGWALIRAKDAIRDANANAQDARDYAKRR